VTGGSGDAKKAHDFPTIAKITGFLIVYILSKEGIF
jgi:hypothetical protein